MIAVKGFKASGPAAVLACQSVEPVVTCVAASSSEESERAVNDGHLSGVLRVNGLENRGHVEFDLYVIAFVPGAVETGELTGCGAGHYVLAVDGDYRLRTGPCGDAEINRKGCWFAG